MDWYSNNADWQAHYETTGLEIWRQTSGRVTHFVAGLGTSETFMGTVRLLKVRNPTLKAISMQPDSSFHELEGLKHIATAIVPAIYDSSLASKNVEVETEGAHAMAMRLAREEGLLLGISAAAVASLQVAEQEVAEGRSATIVTVLCDSADKYFSERFWEAA